MNATPDQNIEQQKEAMLICQVIFKNGQPVLIKALTNYPDPDNPLTKAFDIEALVSEARIDQMEYVNQRLIGKNTSGDRVFYDKDAVIAENRLLDQQRIIFNAMMEELKQTPPTPNGDLGDK